jgi:hypothetical protein
MKYIAHRGLTDGPNINLENWPDQISKSLDSGYDCEVDLWVVDSDFYLGHNGPDYQVSYKFLEQTGLWIHAKNLSALHWLTQTDLEYFWHQEDDFTLTSHNYIWTYPGKELTQHSVMVMPEWNDPKFENLNYNCYGICSDYVAKIKNAQQ